MAIALVTDRLKVGLVKKEDQEELKDKRKSGPGNYVNKHMPKIIN